MLMMPFLFTACSRESEFDRNFKKNCEATSGGNSSYCACALDVLKRNIKVEALPALSGSDIQRLAPDILKTCPAP